MSVRILTPTVAEIDFTGAIDEDKKHDIAKWLSYTDSNISYQLKRHERDWSWKHRDLSGWERRRTHLKEEETKCLYSKRSPKTWRFRTGSLHLLAEKNLIDGVTGCIPAPSAVKQQPYELKCNLPYVLHPYQEASLEALMSQSHAHIEICTGSGKATIALLLAQQLGVPSAIVVPFKENARSLFAFFRYHLGNTRIGLYGDGVKNSTQDVTICIGKSLVNVTADKKPDEWGFFRRKRALIVDESHTWAAETMETLCHGLFAHVPYRYFMSGTQEKSVHQANQLASIIGPRVYSLGTAEAVRDGYICPHEYIIYEKVPLSPTSSLEKAIEPNNVLALRRHHLLLNPAINEFVAKACANDYRSGECSLIMAEEINQVNVIVDHWLKMGLKEDSDFAVATGKGKSGSVERAVDAFNAGHVGILIGTSCIATGVNLYPQHKTYNLCGGGAVNSVRTCQGAVGRSVRFAHSNPAMKNNTYPTNKFKVKEKTVIIDFDLDEKQKHLHRHLKKRLDYYKLSGSHIHFLPFPKSGSSL